MELNADFKSYQDRITTSLVNVTRSASQISNLDLGFHRSSSVQFSQSLDARSTHLLRLTNKLLKAASKETALRTPLVQNADDIDDNWRNIVDVIDDLLEKADRSLDEFTGVIKRLSPVRQEAPSAQIKPSRQGQGADQFSQRVIPKPQVHFARKVNNYDTAPWKPLLTTKPHANMPLEDSIGNGVGGFKHPYAHEIQHMIYPPTMYRMSDPVPYSDPSKSQPIFVDTEESVQEMLAELKLAKDIAIDLEHNDKNSYIGMVCLMQISTRDKDWIVDTLKPWRENLQVLNEVFANPRIVKVLHGSTSDIIWLQRDLGLYIVGLFDTYHASNILHFPSKSLKYLLEKFAGFEAQKQYQLADWRVRPLPQELIDYARSDTHFLLYIYDNLKNMLLEASTQHESFVDHVLDASRREALQVYERHIYDKEYGLDQGGWMRMLLQRSSQLSNEQLGVFRAIHEWRDNKARELDEGEQNVMPNTFVWTLAELMPTYRGALHQRGVGRIPKPVAEHIPEIIEAVKQGIANGKDGPTVHELIEKHSSKAGYMFGRNKYVRKRIEETNRGLGATLQMLNENGELPTTPTPANISGVASRTPDEPLMAKAAFSQLWGAVEPSSLPAMTDLAIIAQSLQNILPLQGSMEEPLGSNAVSAPITRSAVPATGSVSNSVVDGRVQAASIKKDEIFTIRDRSKKRKASEELSDVEQTSKPTAGHVQKDNVMSLLADEDDDVTHDPVQGVRNSKSDQRARKAARRAKKQAEAQDQANARAGLVPFDYATAQSVLHAKPDSTEPTKQMSKNKPLNPFLKALDTSTGARRNRMGKELAGKSHTFKG